MSLLRRSAGKLLALCAWAGTAAAQTVTLEPSTAQRCMKPVAGAQIEPEYPFLALKLKKPGRVKVELEFTGPSLRPAVKVLESEGGDVDDFESAVRDHVNNLRVPCMRPDEGPVRLVQEFVFQPDQRQVHWSEAIDRDAAARLEVLKCMRDLSGETKPEFPLAARRQGISGRVLLRLRFDVADRAPAVEVFARPGAAILARGVEKWAHGNRLPCHTGAPITSIWTYKFSFEGDSPSGFMPATLVSLLPAMRDIGKQTVQFDTTTMSCPFDLRWQYRKPQLANAVGEVGNSVPARRPLIEWLAGVELDLPVSLLDSVYGDTTTVTVPCVKIDLKPKE